MIAVIDYGMGNLRSVQKALEAVGATAIVTRDPSEILGAQSAVLPGVGAFKDCMDNLEKYGLSEIPKKFIQTGKPFLGICLGLQLLFSQSEEFGTVSGLDIFPGNTRRFKFDEATQSGDEKMKVPHMGWNTVQFKKNDPLFEGIPNDSYFYFVHSYYVAPENSDVVSGITPYGGDFVSAVFHENIHAFQFHPEKSQQQGLALLKNFSKLQ
ncbi:MAG: imidazole glycerol phosphate synthase subunit HisH [Candidatus Nitrohelix vancouverensis]|uniref:Imidazole glycerol phosphate synthase subunit HisH n=1 Tax=Candidatus Nitrohelix vancouverensis TaxID=2705534 RepID=A0A7T0C4T1_9BACT|nr:MAG: imidazole glycerol phosphate synthase subunit HisH [Candidatus Nitrohelix vancouverensis]